MNRPFYFYIRAKTNVSPETTLATLVTERPGRSRVLESLGLDYCCKGGQSLESACAKSGKDLQEVLQRLAVFDPVGGSHCGNPSCLREIGVGHLVATGG
ncbi:MAG: hypothetical protein COA70_10410 [Planctomycetota bacterium]|nr:MAG: hypothetical protein COA70_10410 [Planctomycetota bacterium]